MNTSLGSARRGFSDLTKRKDIKNASRIFFICYGFWGIVLGYLLNLRVRKKGLNGFLFGFIFFIAISLPPIIKAYFLLSANILDQATVLRKSMDSQWPGVVGWCIAYLASFFLPSQKNNKSEERLEKIKQRILYLQNNQIISDDPDIEQKYNKTKQKILSETRSQLSNSEEVRIFNSLKELSYKQIISMKKNCANFSEIQLNVFHIFVITLLKYMEFNKITEEEQNLKTRIEQLVQSDDTSALRQVIAELPEPTREKAAIWLAERPQSSTVAILSYLMFYEDIHQWASETLWKLLLSTAKREEMQMVAQLSRGLDAQMSEAPFIGLIMGLMRRILGRELKAMEMENASTLIHEHMRKG